MLVVSCLVFLEDTAIYDNILFRIIEEWWSFLFDLYYLIYNYNYNYKPANLYFLTGSNTFVYNKYQEIHDVVSTLTRRTERTFKRRYTFDFKIKYFIHFQTINVILDCFKFLQTLIQ